MSGSEEYLAARHCGDDRKNSNDPLKIVDGLSSARVCALSTTRAGQDAAAEADQNYGELVSPSLARLLPRDT